MSLVADDDDVAVLSNVDVILSSNDERRGALRVFLRSEVFGCTPFDEGLGLSMISNFLVVL